MKRHMLSMLLMGVLSLLVLAGCRKDPLPKKTDTTFTLTITKYLNETTNTGFFTATGDPTTSGTYTMDVQLVGTDSLHCSQTLVVASVGTITIISDCSMTTNTGVWYITTGTGAYANLKGNGSLIMSPPTDNTPDLEAMYGQTWRE